MKKHLLTPEFRKICIKKCKDGKCYAPTMTDCFRCLQEWHDAQDRKMRKVMLSYTKREITQLEFVILITDLIGG